jgi:amidase
VGWFARDLDTYEAVARVLLGHHPSEPIRRLVVADDITANVLDEAERAETDRCLARVAEVLPIEGGTAVADGQFDAWRQVFRTIQAYEAWRAHGHWIETNAPELGHGIRERFEWARTVSATDYAKALEDRAAISSHVRSRIPPGTALVFPTAPSVAPERGRTGDQLEAYRVRAISMMCTAGLAGLPQLSLPIGTVDELPFGISILASVGTDLSLLATARNLEGVNASK